eukprot:UN08275
MTLFNELLPVNTALSGSTTLTQLNSSVLNAGTSSTAASSTLLNDINIGALTSLRFNPLQLQCILSLCTMLYIQHTVFNLHRSKSTWEEIIKFHPSQTS